MFFDKLKNILITAAGIFVGIEGLKNLPFLSVLFVKYPTISIWINAAASLTVALVDCTNSGSFNLPCALTAIGTFLGAAGIHLAHAAIKPISPVPVMVRQ